MRSVLFEFLSLFGTQFLNSQRLPLETVADRLYIKNPKKNETPGNKECGKEVKKWSGNT